MTRKKTLGLLGPLFCECPPPLGFTPTRNFPRSDAARRVRSLKSSDCFFFLLSLCPFPLALPCWPFPPFVLLVVCVFVCFHFTVFIFILPRFCIPGARLRQLVRCSLGLLLLFYHCRRNGISRWYPYCRRYTRLQFCFPRGFVRFFVLVKAGCVTFWTDARSNRWFFFSRILLKRRGEIGSCMN